MTRKPKVQLRPVPEPAKESAPLPPPGDASPAPAPAVESREDARARAERCYAHLRHVLAEHGCAIVPVLLPPKPVGDSGAEAIISATYSIVPLPRS